MNRRTSGDHARLSLAVICAIDTEHAALRKAFHISADADATAPFQVRAGRTGRTLVRLAQSGIGKTNVAALTAHLLTAYPETDLVVFSGVAGALGEELHPGDLVIAAETATHDYGALREGRLEWFPAGEWPLGPAPGPAYAAATLVTPALERAMAVFRRAGSNVRVGRIISGDVFLNCRDSRDRLQAAWNADAIDMESAAFAEVARRFGKPMAIVRTLSDRACEAAHLSFEELAERAAANSAGFLSAYVAELEEDEASLELIRNRRAEPST